MDKDSTLLFTTRINEQPSPRLKQICGAVYGNLKPARQGQLNLDTTGPSLTRRRRPFYLEVF